MTEPGAAMAETGDDGNTGVNLPPDRTASAPAHVAVQERLEAKDRPASNEFRTAAARSQPMTQLIFGAFAYAAAATGDPFPALAEETEALRHRR